MYICIEWADSVNVFINTFFVNVLVNLICLLQLENLMIHIIPK